MSKNIKKLFFLGDEGASNDNANEANNYHLPVTFVSDGKKRSLELQEEAAQITTEIVVSEQYLRSLGSEEVNSFLPLLESKYKGHDKKKSKKEFQEVEKSDNTSDLNLNLVLYQNRFQQLTLGSVKSLKIGAPLNDEIIDYGLLKVFEMLPPQPTTFILPVHNWVTYFYRINHEQLVDRLYKKLLKMEPTLDFVKLKNLVVPVGQDNHWLIAIVCQPFPDEKTVLALEAEANAKGWPFYACGPKLYYKWLKHPKNPPRILIFDSMFENVLKSGFSLEAYHTSIAEKISRGLLCLHQKFWTEIKSGIKVNLDYQKMIVHHTVKVPSQSNRVDCGLFIMRYLLMWLKEMKECEGDYMKIYTSNILLDKYPEYEMIITRKNLCEDIFKLCKEKSVSVSLLQTLIGGFE